jgi:HAD superfamily hydrolase (TIGR01509 family)
LRYDAVLFDLGSTLIEYENSDWESLGKRGVIEAYPIIKAAFPQMPQVEIFGPAFYKHLRSILDENRVDNSEIDLYDLCRLIFGRMGFENQDGVAEKFVHKYYQPITRQVTMEEGAPEILGQVKESGLAIGLVSNTIFPEKYHLEELARFDLLKYFNFTIFSSSVKTRKPGKGIFELALRLADSPPARTLFVGDRFDADIVGAKNAGLTAVWKFHEDRQNPDNVQPDFSINKLEELKTIIFCR